MKDVLEFSYEEMYPVPTLITDDLSEVSESVVEIDITRTTVNKLNILKEYIDAYDKFIAARKSFLKTFSETEV